MSSSSAVKKVADEVQITHEDQKMINAFANKNAKHNELKTAVTNKKKELQNLEDAADEMILLDDEGTVPVHVGETFMNLSMDEAQEHVESCKDDIQKAVTKLDTEIEHYKNELKELKAKLYAKFGNNINLEEEEES